MTEPRTVVITGASAGIGRATALAFASAGYRVGLLARSQAGLRDTEAELRARGATTLSACVDVADAEAVERAAVRFETELGPIDVWVNSAMATVFSPVSQLTAEEIKRVTEVTYLGFVHGTLAALRHMRKRDSGTIVQVGSALAYRAIPLQSAYCAAKFAVRGFTDALRCELIHDGSHIRLTMVQLPAHNTPQFEWARNKLGRRLQPVPPIYAPEVAARAILRAATEAPRELWLGRATFQSILGTALMPGWLDRLLAKRAYEGQSTNDHEPPRPDNLYQAVDALHRTAGRFENACLDKATCLSSESVGKLLALAAAAAVLGIVLVTLALA